MEPHVKERIVGAAVLVALGVWLFPAILNGPDDVIDDPELLPEILLPAAEPIVPLRTDNLPPDRPAPDPVAAEPPPAAEVSVAAGNTETAGPTAESEAASQPLVEAAADPAPAPVAVAAAPPRSAPAAASPPSDPGGWSVQLGAFGEKANADQLARRVATYGFDAFVSEFRSNGATMYRVRVGGFASEAQADAAASSISAHSIPARVISPE